MSLKINFCFFFACPAYICIKTKFYTHFRFLFPSSDNISSVIEFLAFICFDAIVSIIIAINKLRLLKNLPTII